MYHETRKLKHNGEYGIDMPIITQDLDVVLTSKGFHGSSSYYIVNTLNIPIRT